MRLRRITFLVILSLLFIIALGRKALDKGVRSHHVLSKIVKELNKAGVDVRSTWKGVDSKARIKPVIAPLQDYPVAKTSTPDGDWVLEFVHGFHDAGLTHLLAIKVPYPASLSIDQDRFRQLWDAAKITNRVFICYANENNDAAQKVKKALEKAGYVTFTYLKSSAGTPMRSARVAGQYFGSAGVHLVIDTKIARSKPGVVLEARAYTELLEPGSSRDGKTKFERELEVRDRQNKEYEKLRMERIKRGEVEFKPILFLKTI